LSYSPDLVAKRNVVVCRLGMLR